MSSVKDLETKISDLEKRLKIAEEKVADYERNSDKELMDALYEKAKKLVLKNQNPSVIFLQKNLWVDYPRAAKILEKLKINGDVKSKE